MNQTLSIPSLEEVLEYKNDYVISCFLRDYDMSSEDATDIFKQTLKWLYLCAHHKMNPDPEIQLAITRYVVIIDEMWHTFILCTRDYTDFCNQYFGFYIHHKPNSKAEKKQFEEECQRNPEKILETSKNQYRKQLGFTYDILGEDTVRLWYDDYAEKYSAEKLKEIYLK
jgi:hypothetical protein